MKNLVRAVGLMLALVFAMSLCACGKSEPVPTAPVVDPAEFTAAEQRLAEANAIHEKYAFLVNASVSGEKTVLLDGETTLNISAELPEGMRVSQWTLNGTALDTDESSIELTLSDNSVVKAELRPVRKLTCINCSMQHLDAGEYAGGERFTEFVFEEPYVNPLTGETISDGTLLLCVDADLDNGKVLDHWLINGRRMDVPEAVYSFNAFLTEATTIEAVYVDY